MARLISPGCTGPSYAKKQCTLIITHANFLGFESEGRTSAIRATRARSLGGRAISLYAGSHLICCGGIENARILLSSQDVLARPNSLTGRFFMQHSRGRTATISASRRQARRLQTVFNVHKDRRTTRRETGFGLTDEVQRKQELLNASAVLTYHPRPGSGWNSAQRLAKAFRARRGGLAARDLRRCISDPSDLARNSWWRTIGHKTNVFSDPAISLVVDLEQQLDPDSRVTLAPQTDRLGMWKVLVDWRMSELERRTARSINTAVGQKLEACDLGTVNPAPWLTQTGNLSSNELSGTNHHIDTTRMAEDPSQGVVDQDARVRGTTNLYVAGCSGFPTGGHANPTLTVVALSLRLADHIRQVLC